MTFRTKLLIACMLTTLAGTGLIAWGVTRYAQQRFDKFDRQQSDALLTQFQREFALRGEEVVSSVQRIADAEATLRMALDLSGPQADFSLYAGDAHGLAAANHLDFLELLTGDGSLISSTQWPGSIGYRNEWGALEQDWSRQGAFLDRVESPDGEELGILALRAVSVGESIFYVLGGRRMDREFLQTLVSPPGTRLLLYPRLETVFVPAALVSSEGAVAQADRFTRIIESAAGQHDATEHRIQWNADPASAEKWVALPLAGRKDESLSLFLVGIEQRERVALVNRIRGLAIGIVAAGILLGIFLRWWASARVTRPLARLTAGVREVAAGNLSVQLATRSRDETGQAIRAFNDMIRQLAEQRRELLQAERVTAWRELARRVAHEVKEQLFPLQVAVENLRQTREQKHEQFDPVFLESLATLTAELEKLKTSVTRFSDFAKMPSPRTEPVNVNDALRTTVQLFEPQFSAMGRPPITTELFLDHGVDRVAADPELLRRALENLLLRSRDAMPSGGTLSIRTGQRKGFVRIEVSHTGTELQPQEARACSLNTMTAVGNRQALALRPCRQS